VRDGETAAYARRRRQPEIRTPTWDHSQASVFRPEPRSDAASRTQTDAPEELQPAKVGIVGGNGKRCFDVVAAVCALLLLLPLFLLIAVAIKLSDRGPILFRHRRIGWNGRQFHCLKFRTMAVKSELLLQQYLAENPEAAREWVADHKLRHDPRVTPLGHGLRKTSLDELPQLVNILKGEMSLVGPRPIVSAEVPKYGDAIVQYYSARPGLTGPWQVSGRNDVDYSRRVMFDKQYVERWSFGRDLAIILKTFCVVMTGRGCY